MKLQPPRQPTESFFLSSILFVTRLAFFHIVEQRFAISSTKLDKKYFHQKTLLIAFLLITSTLYPQEISTDAQSWVQRIIERDEATQKALQAYEYDQMVLIRRVDGKNKVTEEKRLEMLVRPGDVSSFTVKGKTGEIIPGGATDEDARAGRNNERMKAAFTLRELAPRFNLTFGGPSTIEGRPAIVIEFTPKEDQLYKTKMERVINHLQGKIWADVETASILKIEANLPKPMDVAWMFATMNWLEFELKTQHLPFGDVSALYRIDYNVDLPIGAIRHRQIMTLSGHRPRQENK